MIYTTVAPLIVCWSREPMYCSGCGSSLLIISDIFFLLITYGNMVFCPFPIEIKYMNYITCSYISQYAF